MKQGVQVVWSLLFLFGCLGGQAQAIILEGQVVDAGTGKALAYVNIGLAGTSIGTVSDAEGQFHLEYPMASDVPVRFSYVGYQAVEISAEMLQSTRLVKLAEEALDLPELIVRPWNNPKRYGSVRSTYRSRVNLAIAKRPDQNLGAAIGRVFRLKGPALLDTVYVYLAANDFDSLTFRLQFYSVHRGQPDQPITSQPAFVTVTGQQRGWLKIPLRHLQISSKHEVMVMLEWVGAGRNGSLLSLPVHFPAVGESHYYRYGSQNQWKRFRAMTTPILLQVLTE